jgi:hypothetical protein
LPITSAVAVAADAAEGRVDRDEVEVAIEHRDGFGHAPQHFAGDAAFALSGAAAGDVARRAGHAQGASVRSAIHHPAARPDPGPHAARAAHAMLRQNNGVSPRTCWRRRSWTRGRSSSWISWRWSTSVCTAISGALLLVVVRTHAAQFAARHVVVPEHLAGGPQRELEALLPVADLREILTLAAAPLHQQPRDRAEQHQRGERIRRRRQRMPPQRRRHVHRHSSCCGFHTPSRLVACTRNT